MVQQAIPAVFMRGGTSKALMLHPRDLPPNRDDWAPLFTGAMGSPDANGRQLDGMGGGVSSVSKVCIISPSERADADVDYTFCQVLVKDAAVQYKGNCGNMSAAVGPFALDEKLVQTDGDTATVRIFNTNTQKIIHGTFPLEAGITRYDGDFAIPGVSGTGAPIRLDFVQIFALCVQGAYMNSARRHTQALGVAWARSRHRSSSSIQATTSPSHGGRWRRAI